MFHKLINNSFVRSSIIFSIANFVVSVIGYLINLIIARAFSLADYGEYMTAMSYTIFLFVPVSTFGLVVIQRIGREVKESRVKVAILLERWLFREIKSNLLPILLLVVGFALFGFYKGNLSFPSILFVITMAVLTLFQSLYSASFQAFKMFLLAGVFLIVISIFKLILSIGVVMVNPSLIYLFLGIIAATAIGLFFGRSALFSGKDQKINEERLISFSNIYSYIKRKNILIVLLTTLGIAGLANIDLMLVKKYFSPEQAGLYSSISLLGKIILYLATPLSQVAFSFFTGSDSRHDSFKILSLLIFSYLLLGSISTAGYYLFPNLIVDIIFGEKFLVIGNIIWLSAIFGTLYSLAVLFSSFFISKNSWLGAFSLPALVFQLIMISFNHQSLSDVLKVNILVLGSLNLVYLLIALRSEFFKTKLVNIA